MSLLRSVETLKNYLRIVQDKIKLLISVAEDLEELNEKEEVILMEEIIFT